ncbi:protein FLUORESCENT IN BLUE LIGHT, chloroplastic-like isoform X2 [Actinidia eriantha]|uniref:protein FLUORESCENT IN BLUE LIGHT, chloroplastic-like isoform X2 n=1 Tax=Actinidia eriantha TaxID=165200 RepID=UPI0025899A8C|nr:protein FLUORESCENT IN BLUE LIGHT, chloroplastic-like isoform X2 [Actinidia eriantha]
MAVVVRCSCVLLRCNSASFDRRTSPSDQFHLKRHVLGKFASIPFKVKKLVSSLGDAANEEFEAHQVFLDNQSMLMGVNDVKTSFSKGTCNIGHTQLDHATILEGLVAHQVMLLGRSPSVALIIANALMLITPFEALAETCEADQSVFNMPLLLFVALIGATVGGLLARQRRGELKRLNEQLRQINAALRRQAKIESYAPTLSYAPVGGRIQESEVIVDPRKQELISRLKLGKNFLRNQDPEKAFLEFKTALELAQSLSDPTEEKKAARGLGASLQRQGKYREAIKYHSMVLAISEREGEDSGNTEAYGAIADCYTELGDLEGAAKFYDNYIARLESD